jgi:hypothetical protein
MAPPEEDVSAGSVLRDLIFNQYQAIVLGGTALVSLIALNPLPLLVWLGSELVLLPVLDSGPLRRLVARRKLAAARARAEAAREQLVGGLTPANAKRYEAMEHLCGLIEANYQSLTGISQAYLSEQRGKLDVILQGCLHRLMALQRYERMPATRNARDIEGEMAELEYELTQDDLPDRAAAAVRKNLELKRKLLDSLNQVGATVKTLLTELDSMESLLEVLHQNSISLRDPQAISQELDTIVRQSEDSERVVREMEALLRADGGWQAEPEIEAAPRPRPLDRPDRTADESRASARRKVKGR